MYDFEQKTTAVDSEAEYEIEDASVFSSCGGKQKADEKNNVGG